MRRILLHTSIILTVLLVTSCRPKGVLSTREMTDLLVDIHLVEAMTDTTNGEISSNWTQGLSHQDFTDLAYRSVLEKHAVTEDEFYQSVGYYSKKIQLFSRIYSNVDKKLQAYAQSIDTWTENKKTETAINALLKKDDARIRAIFERMRIKPDTTDMLSFSYLPDSARAMNARYIDRLMIKSPVIAATFSMVRPRASTGLSGNKDVADTTQQAGSSGKEALPSVNTLLHEALPIEEVLRLREAGAYNSLMKNQKQYVNKPDRNEERTRKLKERAANQR